MKKKSERHNQIIYFIQHHKGASVKDLSEQFNVSEMTIRRDLNILKSSNIISNISGAFFINDEYLNNTYENYLLDEAYVAKENEKTRIGKFASTLIHENDVLILDTGSTTDKLAHYIPDNLTLTILCYNYNILNQLIHKKNISLIFPGGYYHPNTQMFESTESLNMIKHFRANKVFISAAGIHETLGVTCANNYEVAAKDVIIKSGVEKILLADSSKFSKVKSSPFANISDFDAIVTDSNITNEWKNIIMNLGIKLYIV